MKIRNDIIKVYKDVHIWVGIFAGLMLFVAFYAGSITMFEKPLERWATPPSALSAPVPMERAPELLAAVLKAHPEAAKNYSVMVQTSPEAPARVIWRVRGDKPRQFTEFGASFDEKGHLQVEQLRKTPVAQLIDTLHQFVGLPFHDAISRPIMGIIALMYAVALISGVIVLLPTLVKDFFAVRVGKNIKRMWLDVHNALGIVSLPFHLIMAVTCVVFAFHDQIYDIQDKVVYPNGIQWGEEHDAGPAPGAQPLPAPALLEKVKAQLPGFEVYSLGFQQKGSVVEGRVTGLDIRYGTRARTYMSTHLDPYTGVVDTHDLPGHMGGWDTAVNAFFMLHFGSFGGNPVRWMYLLLGLGGAIVFYTGNLLWIESRRRKQRDANLPEQKRSTRVLGSLTIGVSLGCVIGISATLAVTKWLPGLVANVPAWHEGIYYAAFLLAVAWAFLRGAARSAYELLYVGAVVTALIPVGSLAALAGVPGTWNHSSAGVAVDATAIVAAAIFWQLARRSRKRATVGHKDSVWAIEGNATTRAGRIQAAKE